MFVGILFADVSFWNAAGQVPPPGWKEPFFIYKIPTGDWRNEHFHPLVPFPWEDYGSSVFIRNSAPPRPETTFQISPFQSSNPIGIGRLILTLQSVISI